MSLGEIINRLEAEPPQKVIRNGFTNPHSYRGHYDQLAFEPADQVSVREMLESARSAVGATYEGWKGGSYTMNEYTDVWLSIVGSASGETIGPTLLNYMLADEA